MLNNYLDAQRIDDATLVLDAGCGTGLAARTNRALRRVLRESVLFPTSLSSKAVGC